MLTEQLSQLLESIQVLQNLLEEEKLCLKEKSFENLNTLLFNKQKLLQKINSSNQAISTKNNLAVIEQDPALSILKQDVVNQLIACQKNNEINGRLIELSMKSNKHLMQLLTQAKGKNSITYDQKGLLNSGSLLGNNIEA
ncbi:flagella synthesis protein FlgN [uncultured Psychromonas sp.]|uniref:flagella synthesis protein FlgN n=1 Tax=uncultured Psychromonas sp. TaxID=173974 RepID=UPI00262BBB44|nr:flagellar protein FlgN [uncultured Psychromonas sp.]